MKDEELRLPVPFIVGTGRSGTTLLRMMLDAHSELAIPPETNFIDAHQAFERQGVDAAVEEILHSQAWGDCKLSVEEFCGRVEDARPDSFGDVLRLFYRLYAERWGKPRWGDKSPYYVLGMPSIHRIFPEARFVHVIRDGRDFALSTIPLWFGPDTFEEAAREWTKTIDHARGQAKCLPHYVEVRFEDLVRDPAATLRALCEFLELDFEPSMLEYHRDAERRLSVEMVELRHQGRLITSDERLGIHRFVGCPPQADRVGRWRREMDEADLHAFEQIAAETLRGLGYELATTSRTDAGAPTTGS